MAPVWLALDIPDAESRQRDLEKELAEQFRIAGFEVVDEETTRSARFSVAEREGGYFDPHTGWRDEARYETIRRLEAEHLRHQLGCDAIASASVVEVNARFALGSVAWDGMVETIPDPLMETTGWVKGLSLHVRLEDLAGEEIFFHAGAVQLLATFEVGVLTYRLVPVDESMILADEYRNLHAIHRALAPLYR